MQREGMDPENARMEDFLCDFCRKAWTMDRAMVEGHQGACICADCLTIAYVEVVIHKSEVSPGEGEMCAMCRELRDEGYWRSPAYDEALICRRCIKLGAGTLHRDRDVEWERPKGASAD